MSSLLPTKFYLPPTPAGFVARPQLLKQLNEAFNHRLTLVSAPAGAGKTTLVSAWVQAAHKRGNTFGWLSLDDSDNDLGSFLEYLITCLDEAGMIIDTAGVAREHGTPAEAGSVIAAIIRGSITLKRTMVLIFDDYHLIQNKDIHAALENLIEHAPPHLHIVLLTRSDPPFELARLRVRGQLLELRMEQLRFSEEEAALFLTKAADLQLPASAVSALNTRTEGWIAGLQMAAISLRGRADTSSFVTAFTASNRFVFDYLLEQVLNRQPAEVREFLLKTAILDRFNASLCDAVAKTGNAARGLLDIIERENLFLIPLDDERGWYRYHHLFSDLLKLLLERTYPGLTAELHHRTCHWFESQGLLPEALHHGLAAGDMELVANIVSGNVLALVDHAEIRSVLAWLDVVPERQRAALPWLDIANAWGLAYIGQNLKAEELLARAEQLTDTLPKNKHTKALGHIAAVRAYLAWTTGKQTKAAIAWAEKAANLLPAEEIAVRALNLTTLGNALSQEKDDPRSIEILEQSLQLARASKQAHVIMQAASGLVYTCMLMGKSRQAQVVCEESIALAESYQRLHNRPLTAAASVYSIQARLVLEASEFEQALQIAQRGLALSERWGQIDNIMMCAQPLIYGLFFTDQVERARDVIQQMRKIAQKGPPWHLTTMDYVELQTYLDSDPQNVAEIQQQADRLLMNIEKVSGLLMARIKIKQKCAAEALTILERELSRPDPYGDFIRTWLFILKALAHSQQKNIPAALNALKQAFTLAEPQNWITLFVREGPAMEQLLRTPQTKTLAPEFVAHVLKVFETRYKSRPAPVPMTQDLIEPLSERELEVLQHLNSHFSTPEIADLLVVSANTVRTHIKNIYSKLGVHGRSGAVQRARELNLLA